MYHIIMIKNKEILERFELSLIKNEPLDIEKNLRIFEELLDFAREMEKIPPSNPLEGIEVDIRLARILNGIKRPS